MKFEFDEKLLVGVDDIDDQHRNIFNAFNEMLDAMVNKQSHKKFYSYVQFIENYAIEHFAHEEKYMVEYGYYDYSAHREAHQKFLRDFSRTKDKFDEEGISSHLIISTQNWLFKWLKDHIEKVDKEFIEFLKPQIDKNNHV